VDTYLWPNEAILPLIRTTSLSLWQMVVLLRGLALCSLWIHSPLGWCYWHTFDRFTD